MPALPLDEAGKYVAGAYVVFFTLIVVYVTIIGSKIARIARQVDDLLELTEKGGRERGAGREGASPTGHEGLGAPRPHQAAGQEPPRR